MAKTQSIDSMITNELKKNAEYSPYRGTMSYADFGNIYQNKQDAISYYDTSSADALATYGAQRQASIDYAQSVYDNNLSYAENMKGTTYKTAEQARSQAYRDADLTYQRQAADAQAARYIESAYYGAKGEQLARMGLGASGYSDYLESQAYATSRAEAQAAARDADAAKRSARDAETNAKLNADITYAKYMNDADNARAAAIYDADTSYRTNVFEAERAAREGKMNAELQYRSDLSAAKDKNISNYAAYLQMVNSGDYSKDMLDMMGKTLGLTKNQINTANDTAGETDVNELGGNSKQKETYKNIVASNSEYTKNEIDLLAQSDSITPKMKDELIVKMNDMFDEQYKRAIGINNYTGALGILQDQYQKGYTDASEYKKKVSGLFNAYISNSPTDGNDDVGYIGSVKSMLDGIRNEIGEDTYKSIKKRIYKRYYGIKETNGRNYDYGFSSVSGNYINDIYFKTVNASEDIAEKLNAVVDQKEGYLAEYAGDVYVYTNNRWKKIERHDSGSMSFYDKLKKFKDDYFYNTNNVSEGEFNRSSSMQYTYGTYANYIASKRK